MKRNDETDPGFDDIIFRDRNKEYGAYDLRRRYGSTMRISIVAGLIFGASLVVVPFLTADRDQVLPGSRIPIPYEPIKYIPEKPVEQPPAKKLPAEELIKKNQYLPPDIVKGEVSPDEGLMMDDGKGNDPVISDTGTFIDVFIDPGIIPEEPEPVVTAQEMPQFPGGDIALMQFIYDNIRYPKDALDNNIEGKVVVQFVVSATGDVTRVVVLRRADPLLDEEAVRVILSMPKWRPGKNNGIPVPVYFSVPVVFDIR